jgi:hypothetical protein
MFYIFTLLKMLVVIKKEGKQTHIGRNPVWVKLSNQWGTLAEPSIPHLLYRDEYLILCFIVWYIINNIHGWKRNIERGI